MVTDTTYKVGIYLRLSREDERLGESGLHKEICF